MGTQEHVYTDMHTKMRYNIFVYMPDKAVELQDDAGMCAMAVGAMMGRITIVKQSGAS